MKQGCVYLIGAGCGAADLLTLRGRNRLQCCDAVVYDDLIDPAILDYAPRNAARIYMGKREGHHSASQEAINAKLIELAAHGSVVARLKGGDPFVFGRGGEEVLALQQANIPYEVIPGISSAIAIPADAGIPVTHRGRSRSVHIFTGHTADTPDGLPDDISHLARCGGTLVILMGLKRLALIAQKLIEYGRSPDTPAAVISGGNSPHPVSVRGTLADIVQKAKDVVSPAVIVVGDTAAMDLSSTLSRPLAGLKVGVTGTPRITDRLAEGLTSLGAAVLPLAQLTLRPLAPDLRLSPLTSGVKKWLVFTSPNGVQIFFKQLRTMHMDVRHLFPCFFAAIGPATAHALEQVGIIPDLCPEEHTSSALAAALIRTVTTQEQIFLLRSTKGASVLKEVPEKAGFTVTDIPLYDTLPDPDSPFLSADMLRQLDYLIFSSAGGVTEYFRQYQSLPECAVPVCIGPVTADALAVHTRCRPLVADDTSVSSIIHAILCDSSKKSDF